MFTDLENSNQISFECGPLQGLKRLVLVGAKVIDREVLQPKKMKTICALLKTNEVSVPRDSVCPDQHLVLDL